MVNDTGLCDCKTTNSGSHGYGYRILEMNNGERKIFTVRNVPGVNMPSPSVNEVPNKLQKYKNHLPRRRNVSPRSLLLSCFTLVTDSLVRVRWKAVDVS